MESSVTEAAVGQNQVSLTAETGSAKFNLLYIVSDQFRRANIELPIPHTPNLSRFTSESVDLTNAMSNYPVCSPHRAIMMTGLYPHDNGVTLNCNSRNSEAGARLKDGLETWTSVLRDCGYATALIGKWHLESPQLPEDAQYGEGYRDDGVVWDAWSPWARRFGFDYWYSHGCCDNHLHPHYWPTEAARDQREDVDQWSAGYETSKAIEFLETFADRTKAEKGAQISEPGGGETSPRFALMLSWNPPHQPFDQLPPDYRDGRYEDLAEDALLPLPNVEYGSGIAREAAEIAPKYYAAVEAIDAEFGRLMRTLDETGLSDNTIVVFTSDHGMQLGSHAEIYKNTYWAESMRIPFAVRVPGHPAAQMSQLFSTIDVAPTLIGLTGNSAQVPQGMQGRDLSAQISAYQPTETITDCHENARDTDTDDFVLYFKNDVSGPQNFSRGIVWDRYKYAFVVTDGKVNEVCFDIEADPYEQTPLQDSALLSQLREYTIARLTRINDPAVEQMQNYL